MDNQSLYVLAIIQTIEEKFYPDTNTSLIDSIEWWAYRPVMLANSPNVKTNEKENV